MSGVQFHADPTGDSVMRGLDAGMKARKARQDVATDTAIRQGVTDMLAQGGSAGYQAPGSGDPSTTGMGGTVSAITAPQAAPPSAAVLTEADTVLANLRRQDQARPIDERGAPDPVSVTSPISVPAASGAYAAPLGGGNAYAGRNYQDNPVTRPVASGGGHDARQRQLESGGRSDLVNGQGYLGHYQFGSDLLKDAGVYTPVAGEGKNQWRGMFNLLGYGQMTPQQFMQNGPAQEAAHQAALAYLDRQAWQHGLNGYIGQTVGGVTIDPQALRDMQWLGGTGGTQKFLASGGAYNPADANGMTLSGYAQRLNGGAMPMTMPGMMPNPNFNARYDPILRQLANAPGGGAPALQILQSQSRYDMGQGRRSDAYARMAMTAFSRGDMDTGRYYLGIAGINPPPGLGQDQSSMRAVGTAALAAHRLYGDTNQAAAQRFAQTFVATRDMNAAIQAAGPTQSGVQSVRQVDDGNGNITYYEVRRDGTAAPMTGPDGVAIMGHRPASNQILASPGGYVSVNRSNPGAGAQPVTLPNGAPAQAPQRGSAGGAGGALAAKVQALIKAGYSEQDANAIAAGIKPISGAKPGDILRVYTSLMNGQQYSASGANLRPVQWDEQEVEPIMKNQFGTNWRQQMQGNGGAVAVPQPQAAAGPPITAPSAQQQQGAVGPASAQGAPQTGPANAASPQAQTIVSQAKAALAAGRSRAAVEALMRQKGVDPALLGK